MNIALKSILPLLLIGSACAESTDQEWNDLVAKSERQIDGRTYYVVEWDLRLDSLESLRAYYLRDRDGYATSSRPLIVNQVGGADDVWTSAEAHDLTYCVSTTFGANYARAISEMAAASADWARYVSVEFIYDSSQDGSCTGGNNANVTFTVEPHNGCGAASFFPSYAVQTLVMDYDDFDNNRCSDWDTISPNVTTTGVYRHELGHILGFRHEHTRPESGTCFEDNNWRVLTPYDQSSVMHYPWCNGNNASDLSLTDLDLDGSIGLYGLSAQLIRTTSPLL